MVSLLAVEADQLHVGRPASVCTPSKLCECEEMATVIAIRIATFDNFPLDVGGQEKTIIKKISIKFYLPLTQYIME